VGGPNGILALGFLGQGQEPVAEEGPVMFWSPSKAAFRAGLGSSNWAGSNAGVASFATGDATKAQGPNSVAFGDRTNALGSNSSAFGERSSAHGKNSIAAGFGTLAMSYGESVFGTFNTSYTPSSQTEWNANDRLFVVGSGFGDISNPTRRDALVILKNGRIGVGTSNPTSPLNVKGITRTDTIVTDAFRLITANAAGKILQADANGNGNWVSPSTVASGTLNDAYNFGGSGQGSAIITQPGLPFTVFGAQVAQKLFVGNSMINTNDPFFNNTNEAIKVSGDVVASGFVDASGFMINGVPFTQGSQLSFSLNDAYNSAGLGNGRMITASSGAVHIAGTDGLLATGTSGSGTIPATGSGVRMMWYPKKAAFRAGTVDLTGLVAGAEWNDVNVGLNSSAFGLNSMAIGMNSLAAGDHAVASGITSVAVGNGTTATGEGSFAAGFGGVASGMGSTALGITTAPSGTGSLAAGESTQAPSAYESVFGRFNTTYTLANAASPFLANPADRLFVIGNGTADNSRSDAMVILKNGNTGIGTSTPTEKMEVKGKALFTNGFGSDNAGLTYKGTTDYMFIGPNTGSAANGGAIALYGSSNAVSGGSPGGIDFNVSGGQKVRILSNGNVGIGTSTPTAELHVAGTDGLLATGTLNSGTIPVEGAGVRMMWFPNKAAFRVGEVNGTQWNNSNIGTNSIALGRHCTASALQSIAIGDAVTASGQSAVAIGFNSTASSIDAVAIGANCTASQTRAFALGSDNTASGVTSATLGEGLFSRSLSEVTVGRYSTDYTPSSATTFNSSDRIFTVGNGTSTSARSNAMVILKNGNTGIGTSAPDARLMVSSSGVTGARVNSTGTSDVQLDLMRSGSDWRIRNSGGIFLIGQSNDNYSTITDILRLGSASVSGATDNTISCGGSSFRWTTVFATNGTINTSDAREKTNVENLKYGLNELRKLRPVSFDWISKPEEGRKLGLIAQELQTVLPEVVRDWDWQYDEDGTNAPVKVPGGRCPETGTEHPQPVPREHHHQVLPAQRHPHGQHRHHRPERGAAQELRPRWYQRLRAGAHQRWGIRCRHLHLHPHCEWKSGRQQADGAALTVVSQKRYTR
jgi:hypothetical protein